MSSRLFLTGGTGLVGSHVAARFREEGRRVRALVRPSSDTRHLERLGCELVLGDVERPDTLSGAAQGCGTAVHAAALVASAAPWERHRAVNVEGTRNVVAECLRAGCERLVHVSSVAVYGHPGARPAELPLDEEASVDTPLRSRDHYERSKRMAEDVVRRASGDALEWSILRPAVVMGERDRHFTPRIRGLASSLVLPLPGRGEHPLPVVYAGNVAEACRLAARSEAAAGRVYNVADDGRLSLRDLLEEAHDGHLVTLRVPTLAVDLVGRLLDGLAAALPGEGAGLVTGRRLWFASHPNPFRSRRVREELGWSPPVPTLEGWRRSLAWHEGKAARG